jgi:hypothetical protein
MSEELEMEDNDKRDSSNPESPSRGSSKGASEPDLFDGREQTLPRFTIDPGDAPRQRTRTLLGVPTSIAREDASAQPQPLSPPEPPPFQPVAPVIAKAEPYDPAADSGDATSAILDTSTEPSTTAIEVTVDVEDDLNNEITMVNDADVVALPDQTGQLQPVRFDQPVAAAVSSNSDVALTETGSEPPLNAETPNLTAAGSAYPNPSSLAPREVARQATKPKSDSSGSGLGALLVAAVVLLATGAWFLTAGTFRRATLTEVPNQEAQTAAASQPVNNMAAEKTTQEPPPSEAVPTAADSTAQAANNAAPAPVANANNAQTGANESAAPGGPALKNKPSLTATVRGERTRSSKRSSGKAAPPAPGGDLPEGPTRGEVITRLESVRPAVHACAAGRSGVADLDITIAHTGSVMHVLVGGDFAGTTEGSCIARAVRQAHFPAFKQERFRLLYPYAI